MNLILKELLCSRKPRQRFLRILKFAMRTGIFYMVFVIFSMQLLLANHEGKGQNLDSTYVTIEMRNENLKSLLKKIEKQTDLRFSFFDEGIKKYTGINLPKAERSVREVLDIIDKQTGLTYLQVGNNYIIINEDKEKDEDVITSQKEKESILNIESVFAFTVTGVVKVASTGAPLPGVNIIVKGTTRGTVTDIDGNYAINAEDHEVLVFSFIGFQTYETQVSGRSAIDVEMKEDIAALEEVVVNAGYWEVNQRESTGNIAKVTSKEIEKQPVANPLSAIQGRVAGVYINQQTGVPGGGFQIQVRGRNSLRFSANYPLYIIDGVPYPASSMGSRYTSETITRGGNPLSNINPNDIESIEVLKDADATAIYGSRGANGVVLIRTKKGAQGKTKVTFDIYSGVGKVSNTMDLLSTEQYLEMRNEAFANDEAVPQSWDSDVNGDWDNSRYTDWQGKLIGGTANTTNALLSVSGGNSDTQFLIGGGFRKETTVFPGDFSDLKGSGHFNINHTTLDNKFNISLSSSFLSDNNDLIRSDYTYEALTLPPNAPELYDDDGNLNWQNSTWINPLAKATTLYKAKTNSLVNNVTFSYNILDDLKIKSNLGYSAVDLDEKSIYPTTGYNPAWGVTSGNTYFATNKVKTWIAEPQLEYKNKIGDGTISILLGTTFQSTFNEGAVLRGTGFSSDALLENLDAASQVSITATNNSEYRYSAVFGRVNYNFGSKYLLNLTGRRDGSSRFGPGKQFSNFGAIGVGWIFSEESFLNSLPFLSFGKIRASYGVTGNDQIDNYGYLDTWEPTSYPYQGTSGLYPTRLANSNYSWETTRKLEAALELGFLENRISLSTSIYRNRSTNQLVGYSLPLVTGFSTIQRNLDATVQNSGIEFELGTTNFETSRFSWTTSFNLTIPKSELIEYPNIEGSPYANIYAIGESLSISKGIKTLGVDSQTGLYYFEDYNGDEAITRPEDYQIFKSGQELYGGLQNTIKYRGIELDIFFQFVKQTGSNYFSGAFSIPGFWGNQPTLVMDRWQAQGDNSGIQKFTQSYSSEAYSMANTNRRYGTTSLSDASFIRLKNISLSYQLPSDILKKIKIESCRIYIQGQNLLTITNYLGLDPETYSTINLPPLRTVMFGTSITF